MNLDSGRIRELAENEEAQGNEVAIDPEKLTRRQRRERHVSLADHRSQLGKQLTEERRKRGLSRRLYRTLRKRGVVR